jgi:hypothetical protein
MQRYMDEIKKRSNLNIPTHNILGKSTATRQNVLTT